MGARHATHNIQFEDCRNVAYHGKFNANGATHVIRSNIKKSFGHKHGEGTSNLLHHLAEHFPTPAGGKSVGSDSI